MSNNKQSSVDYYSEQSLNLFNLFQQGHMSINEFRAKMLEVEIQSTKMHKEEIEDAWDKGDHCIDLPDGTWEQKYKSGEQYYNETFGDPH